MYGYLVLRIIVDGLFGLVLACLSVTTAAAACGPGALGTSRTITLDATKYRHFRGNEKTLGLRDKEVILTFDDGPIAGKTSRILKALKEECVKATFFYVGRMAKFQPGLVRRVVAEGHTLAHHTHNHNRLPNYSKKRAAKLIDKGISTLQKIAYGDDTSVPRVPFFRYPYLARTNQTDRILARKGLIAFDANIDSQDWKSRSPGKVHNRIMRRLRKERRGIVLMHDIHGRTAKMLPRLLDSLNSEGFKIVHMVPKGQATPAEGPLLMAAAGEENPAPISADIAVDEQTFNERPAHAVITVDDETESFTKVPIAKEAIVQLDLSSPHVASMTSQLTDRTGVSIAVSRVKSLPAARAPKPVSKSLVSRSFNQTESTGNKRTKTRNKHPLITIAGNSKTIRIGEGNWKLRRSQWILR